MAWLLANPERSSGDIFQELQRLSPDAINPCTSAPLNEESGKYGPTRLGNLRGAVARGSDPRIIIGVNLAIREGNQNFLSAS